MRFVVAAWIGETWTGHGAAVCGECGWFYSNKNYGTVGLRAINHNAEHAAAGGGA